MLSRNVAYYIPQTEITGVETCCLSILKKLDREKYNSLVVTNTSGPLLEELQKIDVEGVVIPTSKEVLGLTRKNTLSNLLTGVVSTLQLSLLIMRLAKFLRNRNIEIIHTNHALAHIVGGFAARLAGVRCVWHIHEPLPPGFMRQLYLVLAHFLPRRIIAITEWTRMMFPVSHQKFSMISIIYNGFDFRAFRQESDRFNIRREFNIDSNAIVIGYVSHFAPHKGHTVFLKAIAQVVQQFPTVKALIVGGAVYKAYRHYDKVLENLTEELGLAENVIFTGERSDIPDVMSSLDIFACVSLTEEFNRVIVEAMTFGKPVVISNVRGESVLVEDNVTGLLVPPDDPQSLASAIITLIKDHQLRYKLGSAGKEYVEKTFSIEKTVSDIEDLYEKVVKNA